MEFPRLGQHCNESSCKQLDFLPMKCDACTKIFCRDHIVYATHDCSESYKKNNQIPVCPLCNLPCPIKKGELPDIIVGKHIESHCLSDPAKQRRKVYTNKCSKKGCKKKELIPVVCDTCQHNFCLHHRHKQDHDCKGFQNSGKAVSKAGAAAISRAQQISQTSSLKATSSPVTSSLKATSSPQAMSSSHKDRVENSQKKSNERSIKLAADVSSLQGAMNEEQALAMALQMSMKGISGSDTSQSGLDRMTDQEMEDHLLAQALAISEQEASVSRQRPQQSVRA